MTQARFQFPRERLLMLLVVAVFFVVLLFTRLVDVQVFRGEEFRNWADDNRYYSLRLPPERGVLLDRYGEALVWNKRAYLVASESGSREQLVSEAEGLRLIATGSSQLRYRLTRLYRYPEPLSHVLGYVGPVTAEDLLADDLLSVADIVGKSGLEGKFDQQLRGAAGEEMYEIDATGKRLRLVQSKPGISGKSLQTSLDPQLSQVAWDALGEQRGVVVVMDAGTGQILALVNKPGFDPNLLTQSEVDEEAERLRVQQLQKYFTDPRQLFFNRATHGTYPPGSVFKLVTATAGLELGSITAETTVTDDGVLRVGEFSYANWYYTQFGRTEGTISVQRALSRSNDIYFYKAAEWVGPVKLAEFARLFGFGSPTGVELAGEAAGLVPDPAWKERTQNQPWYLGNTYHYGIGQGDILVTPLQVAHMTQALANEGVGCRPTLLVGQPSDCSSLGLSREHWEIVMLGMLDACSTGGTAFPFFGYNETRRKTEGGSVLADLDQGAVACKTGTAEFGGQDERGYRKTHAWLTTVVGTEEIQRQAREQAQALIDLAEGREASPSAAKAAEIGVTAAGDTSTITTPAASASGDLHQQWQQKVAQVGLPRRLVITVLVESDEVNLYKEGSRDAGPVAKKIVDWMYGEE